jgi:acyl-CoA synthetase (AMP-forming)/AMP-acid ligase II
VAAGRFVAPPDPARADAYRAQGLWDDRSVADGLEAAVATRPAALAVADRDSRLTYEQLGVRIDGALGALVDTGVHPGDAVLLVAGNTVDAVVVYHALLRVGATVVLLDRRCGAADVRRALEVLGDRKVAIVPSPERERVLPMLGGAHPLLLEAIAVARRHRETSWSEPDRDEPRVVLLTSGTTARPKAVVHSLNTVTAGARNMARITAADEHAVLFLASPVASIAGITQLHLFADQHGALVLEDQFDDEASLALVNEMGATLLGGAPVIAERLLRAAQRSPDRRIALRTLALGGAMLPRPLLELATDAFGMHVARVYGSSEAPCATGSVPEDDRERGLADDGMLMPGTEVRVGSAENPKEGMLRGPSLFLGYVDDDDNAVAFEDGWYRTGDLVELNGGRLTVVGRLQEVVNRNGLKISLGEIDAALAGLPGVREYACYSVPDPTTGERLAVALRPEPGERVTLDDVAGHLLRGGIARRKLPEQLVIWDDPLPRTPSGKVVRSRLGMEASAAQSFSRTDT